MSNVLKRIQQAQKAKVQSPETVMTQVASQYIADIKQEVYEKAREEFHEQLEEREKSREAEIEGYRQRTEAMRIEHETTLMLLSQAQSQVAQLNDLTKALKAEVKNNSIAIENLENGYKTTIREKDLTLKQLESELMQERSKPVPKPVIQQAEPMPAFEFTPVKGMDGRIESVTARPIYERTN